MEHSTHFNHDVIGVDHDLEDYEISKADPFVTLGWDISDMVNRDHALTPGNGFKRIVCINWDDRT